jgi:hypothetical protein
MLLKGNPEGIREVAATIVSRRNFKDLTDLETFIEEMSPDVRL